MTAQRRHRGQLRGGWGRAAGASLPRGQVSAPGVARVSRAVRPRGAGPLSATRPPTWAPARSAPQPSGDHQHRRPRSVHGRLASPRGQLPSRACGPRLGPAPTARRLSGVWGQDRCLPALELGLAGHIHCQGHRGAPAAVDGARQRTRLLSSPETLLQEANSENGQENPRDQKALGSESRNGLFVHSRHVAGLALTDGRNLVPAAVGGNPLRISTGPRTRRAGRLGFAVPSLGNRLTDRESARLHAGAEATPPATREPPAMQPASVRRAGMPSPAEVVARPAPAP